MKTSKVDKPGKVYVVTKHTKSGSVGSGDVGKKVSKIISIAFIFLNYHY
jgi:hypothetical protein